MAKRKKYLVTADSEAFACSLVTSPAVEEEFLTFDKDEPVKMQFADEEKHMVIGVVAIPNKPIYRIAEDGTEYDLIFTAEAIEQMEKRFLKDFRQYNVTLQHEEAANGIWLVEQWLKADKEKDKSVAMGLSTDIPVGSWMQVYYVDSNEIWSRIKNGELRGFSLEALIGMEEVEESINNFNKQEIMDDTKEDAFFERMKAVFENVLQAFSFGKKKEVELEEQEPTAVEEQSAAEPQPEPIVEEPTPVVEEPAPVVEEPAPAPVVEEPKAEPAPEPKPNPLEDLIKSLQSEIESLKQTNAGLVDKVNDLSKQPSAKPISTVGASGANGGDTFQSWREQVRKML